MKLQNINDEVKFIEKEMMETLDNAKPKIYNIVENAAKNYYTEATKHQKNPVVFGENNAILSIIEQTKQGIYHEFSKLLDTNSIGFTNSNGEYKRWEWYNSKRICRAILRI